MNVERLRPPWSHRIHVLGSVVLGLLFLIAGASKSLDPWSFHVTLPDYGITGVARTFVALLTPAIEVVLGLALLLRWQTRRASLVAALALAVFLVLIGWGWWRGSLVDCGCFGAMLKRSPGEAFAIDSAFLLVAVAVWRGARGEAERGRFAHRWRVVVSVLAGGVSLAATIALFLVGATGIRATLEAARHPEMAAVDLEVGEHLLYLFHPECPQCARMSPRVAEYSQTPALPAVVGFTTLTTKPDVDIYRDKYNLRIPAGILSRDSLSRITGDGSVPQLVHVRDGEILRSWVTEMPEADELRSELSVDGFEGTDSENGADRGAPPLDRGMTP